MAKTSSEWKYQTIKIIGKKPKRKIVIKYKKGQKIGYKILTDRKQYITSKKPKGF